MIDQGLERKITIPSILKFALPSMVMMVVMSLYTVVDGMFVSRLVGSDAFSAVNIVYPLFSFVIALGTMFGTGITAIVSRKLGEGKQQEALRERDLYHFICRRAWHCDDDPLLCLSGKDHLYAGSK